MTKAPLPTNELARLAALHQCQILNTPAESTFDDITRLAAYICGVPIALVSLVDADRQWFKSKVGIEVSETPREIAFCAHAILQPDILIVPMLPQTHGSPLISWLRLSLISAFMLVCP
jgi:GAF domain-containing protein